MRNRALLIALACLIPLAGCVAPYPYYRYGYYDRGGYDYYGSRYGYRDGYGYYGSRRYAPYADYYGRY